MNTAPLQKKIECAIVCDDVRREDNGKFIIIGAYGSDIRVSLTPANLRLSLLVAARSETEHQTLVSVRVTQDGKRIFELPKPLEFRMPAQEIAGSSTFQVESSEFLTT